VQATIDPHHGATFGSELSRFLVAESFRQRQAPRNLAILFEIALILRAR
jgi:hypothetical protein